MTKTKALVALIFWMFFSLLLVCSVVGLLLFIRTDISCSYWQGDEGRSTWANIGMKLLDNFLKEKNGL